MMNEMDIQEAALEIAATLCHVEERCTVIAEDFHRAHEALIVPYLQACGSAIVGSSKISSCIGAVPLFDELGKSQREEVISRLAELGVYAAEREGWLYLEWGHALLKQADNPKPSVIHQLIVDQIGAPRLHDVPPPQEPT